MKLRKFGTAWAFGSAAVCGALTLGLAFSQPEVTGQEQQLRDTSRAAETSRASAPVPERVAAPAVANAKSLSLAFRSAAEKATPSVVKISAHTNAKAAVKGLAKRGANPFKGTPFEHILPEGFEGMEGMEGGRVPQRDGVGSGVIIDAGGIVITNNHVVEGADVVTVKLTDGREFKATDIKTDPASDLAVLRLKDAKDLPFAKLGNSDDLETGDWVIAIGNPFELETTVSAGIISGKGRELSRIRRAKFLQTDAAINPGNSGGPLVNLDGEVVGINTAIASSNGGYQGIGFAIPVNLAKWVTTQLIDRGSVQRGYLGVGIDQLSNELAEKLGAKRGEGVVVTEVMPKSPAGVAGVQEGDVIVRFNNQVVRNPRELQELVERTTLDSKQSLSVLRDGTTKSLSVTVKALPEKVARADRSDEQPAEEQPSKLDSFEDKKLGFEVADLSSDENQGEASEGVVIRKVEDDGPAAQQGLRAGMVIRKVGRTTVKNVQEFAKAVKKETDANGVLLQVRTQGGNRFVVVKPVQS